MVICQICNVEFENNKYLSSHIRWKHKMTSKDYYDTYLKKENEGICPICGQPTKFNKLTHGYITHCSLKCALSDNNVKNKRDNTMINKYGVNNNFIRPEIISKAHSKEAQEKKKQTNLERYGVECVSQSPIIQERIKNTMQNRYGVDYYCVSSHCRQNLLLEDTRLKKQQTMFTHFGCLGNLARPEIHQKTKISFEQNHNGIKYAFLLPSAKQKAKSKIARQKGILTKKKNNTLTSSNIEINFEKWLINNNIQYIKEYYSEYYPYHCDFYIPSKELYIEINAHWTHGGHWFNKNNQNDINILEKWQEKAKTSNYYKVAVNVWTVRDVEKYKIAQKNKLNYKVLWNKNDIQLFQMEFLNYLKDVNYYEEK